MNLIIILFILMWFAAATQIIGNIAPYSNQAGWVKQLIICAVVLFGTPFMMITQCIEFILDSFLEEGWKDDEDDKFGT